jgi:transposase
MDTMPQIPGDVTVGVDTHRDSHTAAVLDAQGRLLGTAAFPTTPAGYRRLIEWAGGWGTVTAAGVEGTGSWGAGLTRHLQETGITVIEVIRPNRQHRRRHGKSDTTDAVAAARAVQSGEASGTPRGGGATESLRMLRVARNSARKAKTQVANQIKAVVVTGPAELRQELRDRPTTELAKLVARFRPGPDLADPSTAAKTALQALGRHWLFLDTQIGELTAQIADLTTATAPPALLDEKGIGPIVAADLLITHGTNPDRIGSAAAFAALCGSSPVDMSSGQQLRHRLNRGGDRQANAALYRAVIVRLRYHQPTRDYMQRRLAQGKTKKEVIRCLKRSLARKVYKILRDHQPPT